jgi:2-keto-4-pentenoate hydratase/2-oxohepta-3-ene-1,7-dioic acid hydratase in catechol pathway
VTQPDYEGELAVWIGTRGRDVPADDALSIVAGVSVAHDVSSRDHQYTTGQWSWSKSFDTFCPLGPELVSLDEIDLAVGLAIETRVSGEVLQSSNTSQLIFGVPELIAWISQGCTLEPGDVILTGTPSGVGAARTPPRWLVDGDVVEITIDGVGTLRNPVARGLG